MVVDEEDDNLYLCLWLEVFWKKFEYDFEGEIDYKMYFIKVVEGVVEEEDNK